MFEYFRNLERSRQRLMAEDPLTDDNFTDLFDNHLEFTEILRTIMDKLTAQLVMQECVIYERTTNIIVDFKIY